MSFSGPSIEEIAEVSDAVCCQRIVDARQKLGKRVTILGHHYQREEVFQHADFTGDSLKLSRLAAESEADYIVFCGVHFMAEVADILSKPDQVAVLPDLAAGCSMADMADLRRVERAWEELSSVLNPDEVITPITYINSAADLKSFCGRHGGLVCTSSNAGKVLDWAFNQREKILFFPDEHLGRNTALSMGIKPDEMEVWDFSQPRGGLSIQQIKNARLILWKGFCSVHQMFKPEQIDQFKKKHPETIVISHPEASHEVCAKSDFVGSTEFIIKTIGDADSNTRWLVATEMNLVKRLHETYQSAGKAVHFMSPQISMCSTMFRIDPQHLLWVLENLVGGNIVNQVKVKSSDLGEARAALDRMLALT